LKKSLAIKPTAVGHTNMGLTMAAMGRHLNARDQFIKSLQLHPDYMGGKWNLALLDLGMGNWEKGFEEYECRVEYRGEVQYPKLPYPMWNGEDLNFKTLFVHGEQGIGDRILFARYLYWLKQAYPDCIIKYATLDEAKRLLWDYRKVVDFVDTETPFRDIQADYGVFLLSLPRFAKSTPSNVPPDPGYIRSRVEPDKDLVLAFKEGGPLYPRQKSLKVGIRWSGNAYNEANDDRKIPFEFLLELAENPNVTLYSLQVGEGSEQIAKNGADNICVNVGNAMASKGYIGTALVLLHLDLVVTTCTSVAHLSAAMGIPTWVLLSSNPYWVWGNQGRTTPWYPAVRRGVQVYKSGSGMKVHAYDYHPSGRSEEVKDNWGGLPAKDSIAAQLRDKGVISHDEYRSVHHKNPERLDKQGLPVGVSDKKLSKLLRSKAARPLPTGVGAIPEVAVAFVPLSTYDELAAVHQPAAVLVLDGGLA
jgi:hypothetical protein